MRNVLLIYIFLSFLSLGTRVEAAFYSTLQGEFSGWVSKLNTAAELVRFKVVFDNLKYLNKGDAVAFWNDGSPGQKCKGYIIGKSVKYILVKVNDMNQCERMANLAAGSYTLFFSQDLLNNLKMGKELVKVLLKKHLALEGKMSRQTRHLESYLDKMSAVNIRYQVLREKLEKEWRDEIAFLEEDRLSLVTEHEQVKTRLNDVNFKLEKYHVSDDNFMLDRWSLNPAEYVPR